MSKKLLKIVIRVEGRLQHKHALLRACGWVCQQLRLAVDVIIVGFDHIARI